MRKYLVCSIFCSAIIYGIDAFPFFQAALSLWNGKTDRLIESHEVEKEFKKIATNCWIKTDGSCTSFLLSNWPANIRCSNRNCSWYVLCTFFISIF